MSNIWFTSDTHAFHKNICEGCSSWQQGDLEGQRLRPFKDQYEMTSIMADNFNHVIKPDDILYHLGDWSFGGYENIQKFRDMLVCKNIHLIFGNHDQHIEPINSPYRKLFSSCEYYKKLNLKVDRKYQQFLKTTIIMSHYGMRVWDKSHHGSILLYGHSHGTLPDFGRSMDVGVDTNKLYPYHLDEILDKMLKIPVKIVDHHNKSTN